VNVTSRGSSREEEAVELRASAERIRHDVETIAGYSSSGPGTNRLSFTPEYWAAVDYVAGQMRALGFERRTTPHGNTRFRRRGAWAEPAIAVGSHLDAVPRGGRFDGVAGVVAGVEIARLLTDLDQDLERPFEVVVFAEEEGARFGSVLAGSKAFTGRLTESELAELRDADGTSYLEALGGRGDEVSASRDAGLVSASFAAYFELHIEQSLVLESARVPIGIVQAIVGLRQYRVTFSGVANHAGATPMHLRRDSLAAAARAISSVEELAASSATGVTVGTVGMLLNEPNAANVIPSRTVFSVDIRDTDAATLDETAESLRVSIGEIATGRQVEAQVTLTAESAPVVLSPRLREALLESARRQGIDCFEMPSGAAHDAQEVARVSEAAMIFVPSIGGRSHCPEEDTSCEAIALGVEVLLGAILKAGERVS
jgi:hydantoinase/carbamoylase family amidase